MLRAVWNKSWMQQPTKQQVYGHLPLISQIIQVRCPGGNTPQDTNCTATCLLSRKLFKLDKPDMQDTAGEVGMNS